MSAGKVIHEARNAAEIGANKILGTAQSTTAKLAPSATVSGGRTQPPLSGRLRSAGIPNSQSATADYAVLCNITEQTWILHRTHGAFVVAGNVAAGRTVDARSEKTATENSGSDESYVPASDISDLANETVPYALTRISARTGAIDLGDKRTLEFPISARDIAEDLAREINADGGENSYFGVFVCAGDEPDMDELAEARERLALFYASLVSSADKQWERTHSVALISDLERRAARELRLEKDWSYEPTMRHECPACGERLKPNVAVCRTCGAVLNREKAAQWGLGAPEVIQRAAEAVRPAEVAQK
jgi:hypothetical protein